MKNKSTQLLLISLFAATSALNYRIFVFPNSFAPAGLDGLCTMFCYVTKIDFGSLALLCNIPLLILSFIFLSRDFCLKTAIYIVVFSVCSTLLNVADISQYCYHTDSGTSIVLAPVAAGVIRGLLYAVTLKVGATAGGNDIVAALIHRKHPEFNFMSIIFALNSTVALLAYFVYGFQIEPVICSIIYSYLASTVSDKFSKKLNQKNKKTETEQNRFGKC